MFAEVQLYRQTPGYGADGKGGHHSSAGSKDHGSKADYGKLVFLITVKVPATDIISVGSSPTIFVTITVLITVSITPTIT